MGKGRWDEKSLKWRARFAIWVQNLISTQKRMGRMLTSYLLIPASFRLGLIPLRTTGISLCPIFPSQVALSVAAPGKTAEERGEHWREPL